MRSPGVDKYLTTQSRVVWIERYRSEILMEVGSGCQFTPCQLAEP